MKLTKLFVIFGLVFVLSACEDGDDGDNGAIGASGPTGAPGSQGTAGLNSITVQTELLAGSAACPAGGTQLDSGLDDNRDSTLSASEIDSTSYVCAPNANRNFNRIATYPVCKQIDPNCDDDTTTVAEISTVTDDGLTVIYTDSEREVLGFVDISDPSAPVGDGVIALAGEPTSVAVAGDYVLVGVVDDASTFAAPDGALNVYNLSDRTLTVSITGDNVGDIGQPDSVAVSPDGRYAAIVIENERDEDLGDGAPPQLPSGYLVVVDMTGAPAAWTATRVDMDGVPALFPTDPEPEYVDINEDNIAVVTLQENNHIVLVDLATATITNDFTAGTVDLINIDATEEDPAIISLSESQNAVPREPDGVVWITNELFATADEGDLDGGSRGFTIFNQAGDVVFSSGNTLEHLAVSLGHYPDDRSGNKGNEPENVEVGQFGNDRYLFVNSERSSLVFVYNVNDPANPVLMQSLPAAARPEGALAITSRNLLVVSSEADDRGDKLRGGLNIYKLHTSLAQYPTLVSVNAPVSNTPIPWSAMSGLAADPSMDGILYAVEDSFYGSNRIFSIDISRKPAQITETITMTDDNDVFAGITTVSVDAGAAAGDASRRDVFDNLDLAAMINDDKSLNIDPEGIAVASDGGFWVVSEGAGTIGDVRRPINSLNFVFKTDAAGVIEAVDTLPDALNAKQVRFGFEGVAEYDGKLYVTIQRAWTGDANPLIAAFDVAAGTWETFFYPLETPASQNGGWVGMSDITSLGGGEFLVVERDDQGGPDAAIKRLYRIDVAGAAEGDTLTKTLVRDLMADLAAPGGLTAEKIEGSAVTVSGDVWVVNDNDGVDDNSGETQLLNLGDIL